MTLREFIKEATELCNGDLDTELIFDDPKIGYCQPVLEHDGEDLIIQAGDEL